MVGKRYFCAAAILQQSLGVGVTAGRGSSYSLMVGKGVAAHSAVEHAFGVRVLFDGTKVEHPEVLPVSMFQESFGILSAVAIETFDACSWVSHYHHMIGNVCEVCRGR